MPELIFLPDRDGTDKLSSGAGLTRMEGTASAALQDYAARLLTHDAAAAADEAEMAAWRGALATALLLNLWDGVETRLSILTMDEHTSPFAAMVMASRPLKERHDPLHLVLLEKDGLRQTLGLVSRRTGLIPAANPGDLSALLPERVRWYDRKAKRFLDPTPMLNERDGELLVRRLHLLRLSGPEANAFIADLVKEQGREAHAVAHHEEAAMDELFLRVKAVIGLEGEGFAALTVEEDRYRVPAEEPLLRCFTDAPGLAGESLGPQKTYCWRGVPFARASVSLGLRSTNDPREQQALGMIREELSLLDEHSRRWQSDAALRIGRWLERADAGRFSPAAREAIESRRALLEASGRQPQETVALTWPWDEHSDAARLLLRESLGEALAFSGSPFSRRLTLMEGTPDMLGDTALRLSCRLGEYACLPPLSETLAACLYHVPEGQGFVAEQLYLIAEEDGSVTATFLLRGTGEAAFVRRYAPDEIVTLSAGEAPTIAVWPCMPFADERWHAYSVYLHSTNLTVRTLSDDGWVEVVPGSRAFATLRSGRYPACLTVFREGECLGALPNALPAADPTPAGPAIAALDIGASGITAMLRMDGLTEPLAAPCLLRTLISGPDAAAMADEFMTPAVIKAVTPTCVLLTGDGAEPLTDGRLLAPILPGDVLNCANPLLSGSLSWRGDAMGDQARELALHQLMLQASLAALLRGATSISWRLSLPGSGGKALWQRWIDPANALAEVVAKETGLPLSAAVSPVTWTTAHRALGAHLRDEAVRGSFIALDFSGGGTGACLWMRSMNKPVAGYHLQGGMQALLLGALTEHPQRLHEDFADCPDETLRHDLDEAASLTRGASPALRQMDKALLLADLLIERHGQALTDHMNMRYATGRMTWLQALLVEHFAMALTLSGLLLEQTANDTMLSHLLPEEMAFCLSGRGSLLLSAVPPVIENNLALFVRSVMSERHPVRGLLLRQSPEPKSDVCRGLTQMSLLSLDADGEEPIPPIRTSESFAELVMRFLSLLRAACPQACELMHPGLFSPQGQLTIEGEAAVRRACAHRYDEDVDIASAMAAALHDVRLPAESAQPPSTFD